MDVVNGEALTAVFGRWPTFHDAEVIAARLERGGADDPPSLELDVHLWEMTSEVDSDGYYVTRSHTLTTLRFVDIDDLDLGGFNGQNVIADLRIEDAEEDRLSVDLSTSYGLSLSLRCARCEVVRAGPLERG